MLEDAHFLHAAKGAFFELVADTVSEAGALFCRAGENGRKRRRRKRKRRENANAPLLSSTPPPPTAGAAPCSPAGATPPSWPAACARWDW